MKSRASIDGHPIHPILVSFPIAFFSAALVFDILSASIKERSFRRTAEYLSGAGVVGGLSAAVPGIIDYFETVPPDSSAKDRATKHGLLNISLITLFSIAWLARRNRYYSPISTIALESIGFAFMAIAGWMGGTLITRNQIGVYNRYASGGKWDEESVQLEDKKAVVAEPDELEEGQMKLVHANGMRIVVGRLAEGYCAFDDSCTHRGGSLAGGVMIMGVVQCPWHGSEFDCKTGEVVAGPATDKINTYKVYEEGGKVWLEVL